MKDEKFDKDNFVYMLEGKFKVEMTRGKLTINDLEYEYNEDATLYAFARVIASAICHVKNNY